MRIAVLFSDKGFGVDEFAAQYLDAPFFQYGKSLGQNHSPVDDVRRLKRLLSGKSDYFRMKQVIIGRQFCRSRILIGAVGKLRIGME